MRKFLVLAAVWSVAFADDPSLPAAVNYQDSVAFVVTNEGTQPWTDCIVKLNPHGFSSGYEMHLDRVEAGATVSLALADFVEDDGTRFDPFTHKVMTFYINCEMGAGTASYMLSSN